jgi:hypothetical protein
VKGEKTMIHIENKRTYRGEGIYVGRKMPGLPGSVLGNPFRIGRDGTRVQIICKASAKAREFEKWCRQNKGDNSAPHMLKNRPAIVPLKTEV